MEPDIESKFGIDGVFSEASGLDIQFTKPVYLRKDYESRSLFGRIFSSPDEGSAELRFAKRDWNNISMIMRDGIRYSYLNFREGHNAGMAAARHPYSLTREEYWAYLCTGDELKIFAHLGLDSYNHYAKDAISDRDIDHGRVIIQIEGEAETAGAFFKRLAQQLRFASMLARPDRVTLANQLFGARYIHGEFNPPNNEAQFYNLGVNPFV